MNESIFESINWKNISSFFVNNNYYRLMGIVYKHFDPMHKGCGVHLLMNDFSLVDIEDITKIVDINNNIVWQKTK